ncbi:MAG: hypothetical protein ACYC6A_14795 [Armatimonadota bacterium]
MVSTDFRKKIILLYFHSSSDQYSLNDLIDILGITNKSLESDINCNIKEGLLVITEIGKIQVTELGEKYLIQYGLFELSFSSLFDEPENHHSIEASQRLNIGDIYIPAHFDKKFLGYNRGRVR